MLTGGRRRPNTRYYHLIRFFSSSRRVICKASIASWAMEPKAGLTRPIERRRTRHSSENEQRRVPRRYDVRAGRKRPEIITKPEWIRTARLASPASGHSGDSQSNSSQALGSSAYGRQYRSKHQDGAIPGGLSGTKPA